VDKLITEVNYISENNGFRRFKLYTSIDTWGARAEYIRTGLDLKIWERNFHAILSKTKFPITFMITFNILSVTTFKSLLEKILEWRTQYGWYNDLNEHRIRFDTPHLKEPLQYDMNILPKDEFMPYMYDSLKFMQDNVVEGDPTKFSQIEFEKFRRVVDYMATTEYGQDKITEGQRDFYNWFNELDTRRGTNFVTNFPEMEKFFKKCGKL
jgi:hypothetical protein